MIEVARREAGEPPALVAPGAGVRADSPTSAVTRLREEVERERVSFDLERLRDERREWGARREEVEKQRRAALEAQRREAAERAAAERRAQVEAGERRRQEAAAADERRRREAAAVETERRRQERRRELIGHAKRVVEKTWWLPDTLTPVPADVRSAMLVDVEKTLTGLQDLESLPEWEVKRIAERIVEKHGRPLADKLKQEETAKAEREAKRQRLVEYGVTYAGRELDREDDLDAVDKWSIQETVRRRLEEQLTPDWTRDDAEELTDGVIEDELD